jgi:oligoendopeptidase F
MSTITDRYSYHLEVEGQSLELTREELRAYFHDKDPNLREAAYEELLRVYERDKNVIGQLYQYRVMDWYREKVELRHYKQPISVRNLGNDIPDEVVEILLSACRQNSTLFQKYYQIKARWLRMEQLRRYDLLAPVLETDRTYSFQEAADLVLGSFHQFHPKIAELAERVFLEKHIDSDVRKGKRGGAFCSTIEPGLTPWILQTFRGRPEDVSTMAHELGHAVHSMLSSTHSALTQHASLPLAETASNFGEMIVVDRLLAEDPDPALKIDLLFRTMDRNYSSIMRQAYFAIFEQDAHKLIVDSATIDDVSDLYAKNLADQFGTSVVIPDTFKLEWLTIPHFFRYPFYVYAYAFGQLLVLSLYQQYKQNREDFVPRFLELLSFGGSAAPIDILERTGVDIRSIEFWQGGFEVLGSNLQMLEELELMEGSKK